MQLAEMRNDPTLPVTNTSVTDGSKTESKLASSSFGKRLSLGM